MDKWSFEVTNKAGGRTHMLTATIPAGKSRETTSTLVKDVTELPEDNAIVFKSTGNDVKYRSDNPLRRLEDRLEVLEKNNERNEKGLKLLRDITKNLGDLASKNSGIDTIVIRHETVEDNNTGPQPPIQSTVAVPTRAPKPTLSSGKRESNLLGPPVNRVTQVAHAIEEPNDPFPNSYYDVHTDSVRVYHGAVYGNPRGDAWPSSHLTAYQQSSWYQPRYGQYSPYWLPWPMPTGYPYAAPPPTPVAYPYAAPPPLPPPPPPPPGRYVLPAPSVGGRRPNEASHHRPYPRERALSTTYYELGNQSRAPSCANGDSGSRVDANRIESIHRGRACVEKNTNTQHMCSGRSHTARNHGSNQNPNAQRTGPPGPEKRAHHQESGNRFGRAGPPQGRPGPNWSETKSERDERTWAEQGRGTNQAWSGVSSETGSERAEREARERQQKGTRR